MLLELVIQLRQIDTLPDPIIEAIHQSKILPKSKYSHLTISLKNNTNGLHIIPNDDHNPSSPRVPNSSNPDLTTVQVLLQHSTLLKNVHFQNAPTLYYSIISSGIRYNNS